jgi:tetratricopeptide (TPR) repeat protein
MTLGAKIKIRFAASAIMAVALLLWMTDRVDASAVAGKAPRTVSEPATEPAPIALAPAPQLGPPPVPQPQPEVAPASAPIAITPPVVPAAVPPAAAIVAPAPMPVAAENPPAAVGQLLIKTGNHGTFARVAFECPQMTDYHIVAAGDILHVTLNTKAAAKIASEKTQQIKKITAAPQGDSLLKVDITTVAGASFKEFRFQNRIILDIYSAVPIKKAAVVKPQVKPAPPVKAAVKDVAPKKLPATAPPEQKAAEQKPAEQKAVEKKLVSTMPIPIVPQKAVAPEKVAAVPVAPVDTSPVLSDPEAIAAARLPGKPEAALPVWNLPITKPDGGVQVEQKTQAAPPAPPVQPGDEDRTATVTMSSLVPMRLAVFERFSTLWIVTDATGADATLPSVSGKMADFIAPAKILRFKQGTAYSYALPQKFFLNVTKQRLSWQVELLPNAPPPAEAFLSAELRVQFDRKTKEAMLVSYMKGAGNPLSFDDPEVGDRLYVVPTSKPHQAVQEDRHMTDIEIIPAATGLVIRPLKDGVNVQHIMLTDEVAAPPKEKIDEKSSGKTGEKPPEKDNKDKAAATDAQPQDMHPQGENVVVITAPFGLSVTPGGGAITPISAPDDVAQDDSNRLFDFPNWRHGGVEKLSENRQKLQAKIAAAETPEERAGGLMDLAKLYFANNFGQETLGILDLVLIENPEMEKNPDFIALRGAASAMSGHYKDALQDLSMPAIQQHPEVNLWIGFAAAASEQWHMADRSFPKSNRLLLQYPDNVAIPFTIYMAESALHLGHTDTANQLLNSINRSADSLDPQYKAAVDYLRGIAFSQMGQPEKAIALWQPVADGLDRLYHAKASLSLTRLLLQQKKITNKEAIDRVDSLRFAWRGDGLEVNILHTLGALKAQDGQILSGLEDMKRAADLADSLNDDSAPVRDDMKHIFTDLFLSDTSGSKVKPLEMVSVYNEFSTLIPPGPEAATAALNFADSLIRMDLLGKAAEIMEEQLKSGNLPEDKSAALGVKMTAVYLLDSKPKLALAALQETDRPDLSPRIHEERLLLKARAESQLGLTSEAITVLSTLNSKNAQRLKADVLWRAQKWDEAATATEALLPDLTNPLAKPPVKPLSDEEASYVVNAAVAWKLAGNMDKLKEIKTKYDSAMAATKLASTFDVVTRDGGSSALGDRETMLRIAGEVDMFKGFLENYKAGLGSGS